MELDENQKKIAYDFDGEIAVVAGPGSGKTRCLIERTYNMYNSKIDPKSILLISYTNKIRAEIKYRLRQRNENLEKVLVHTFHSFGIYLLRKYGFANRILVADVYFANTKFSYTFLGCFLPS